MTAISNGGAAQRVKVLTDADLRANGGQYSLEGRPPVAVYGVTDAETTAQGGDYVVMGNVAQPVYVVDPPDGVGEATIAPIPMIAVDGAIAMGNVAIPVYVVGGSLPSGGGFDPNTIAGLVLWLDGADSATLFQDVAGTSPVTADGQSVARWDDKSTSANNVTQGTSNNRPTRQTSSGYVGVRFDGTNDNLAGTVINVLTNISLFCVVRLAGTSISGAMVKNGDSGDGWGLGFGDTTLDGDGNNLIWLWEQLQWRATTSNTQIGRHIEVALITGGNGSRQTTMREDGVEIYDQPSSDGITPTTSLLIGGYFRDTDRYFNNDILEILIYTQALDPTEVGQVETYLANKWGITL